ncbi:MAG: ferric uptake regulator, Fur family [Patescibacteria group bacterium]|jgi:Fur family ferric uptake transcriptional regulator|nr:ferric uptake regulator, Fur family [Patescibacteria group bacterium]
MNNSSSLLSTLSGSGHRLTPVRRAIVTFFDAVRKPVPAESVLSYLEEKELHPNKTTVYRELEFLKKNGIIAELDFAEGKKRYELASHGHHHHLICTSCNDIEAVHIKEENLHAEESKVLEEKGFKVTRHMLEFFGLCKRCQK